MLILVSFYHSQRIKILRDPASQLGYSPMPPIGIIAELFFFFFTSFHPNPLGNKVILDFISWPEII